MTTRKTPQLGQAIVYHAHEGHHLADGGTLHHPEMREFAGLIVRVHDDGSADLVFFVPHRANIFADHVMMGDGPHTYRLA